MERFSQEWIDTYYHSILTCADRYKDMAQQHGCQDLLDFLEEFNRDVPLLKIDRWLGYVQGVLIERKITTVTEERDWTRKYFRPLDFI